MYYKSKSKLVKWLGIPITIACAAFTLGEGIGVLSIEQKNPYTDEPIVQEYKDVCFTDKNLLQAQAQIKNRTVDEKGILCAYEKLKTGRDTDYDSGGFVSETRKRAESGLEKISADMDILVQKTEEDLKRLEQNPVVRNYKEYNQTNFVYGSIGFLLFGALTAITGFATKYYTLK